MQVKGQNCHGIYTKDGQLITTVKKNDVTLINFSAQDDTSFINNVNQTGTLSRSGVTYTAENNKTGYLKSKCHCKTIYAIIGGTWSPALSENYANVYTGLTEVIIRDDRQGLGNYPTDYLSQSWYIKIYQSFDGTGKRTLGIEIRKSNGTYENVSFNFGANRTARLIRILFHRNMNVYSATVSIGEGTTIYQGWYYNNSFDLINLPSTSLCRPILVVRNSCQSNTSTDKLTVAFTSNWCSMNTSYAQLDY